jgi:hypothetical protein
VRASKITVLAVAALIATPLAGAAAAPASAAHTVTPALFVATDEGFGATLAAAEQNARIQLIADYGPCYPPYDYYSDGQLSSGTWYAYVKAECSEYH